VAYAREVGASAALLHDQDAIAKFANPPAEALTLAETVFGQLDAMQHAVDADTAAALITSVASQLVSDKVPPGSH
jgi:hypothetical protein